MGQERQPAGHGNAGPSPRERFLGGMRVGLGLAVAVFVLGVTFGALARAQGWGVVAPTIASVVVFSGTAQLAMVAVFAGGGGILAAVAAAALINARFLSMGLAVGPSLRGGRLRRAVEGQAVVDGSWVAAHRGGGRFDRERLIGATIMQYPAWVGGTILGVLVAPPTHLVETLGLDVVFPAYFLVLLLDELRTSRQARRAAAASAALTGGLLFALPAGLVLIASTAAAFLGLRSSPRKAQR